MSDVVIKAENLGKKYTIGHQAVRDSKSGYTALRDVMMQNVRTLWKKSGDMLRGKPIIQGDTLEEVWALKDVNFEIRRGEVVGIIGKNGAGKSTLLKVLSRITEPSAGRVTIKGRVASLLEVGTGFHPELTGRENIYLNGAILGMTRVEIRRKFDEIVAFAEVEKYLDTPVKRYSSGMYVRLAFAVAAHLEPEILLVDEVLAVGDAAFQKKSLGKMGEVAQAGRTVLFVSHNLIALQNLCPEAFWINAGNIVAKGSSPEVISRYLKLNNVNSVEQVWENPERAPGNEKVRLHKVWLEPENGDMEVGIPRESPLSVGVEYWHLDPGSQIHVTLLVYVEQQIVAFSTASSHDSSWKEISRSNGLIRSVCHIPANFLNIGQHKIGLLFVKNRRNGIFDFEDALSFEIVETKPREGAWYGKAKGVVRPVLPWTNLWLNNGQ